MKREAESSSESLENVARCHIQEDLKSYQRCCESLKCRQIVAACTVDGTPDWAVQLNTLIRIGQFS